MLAEPPAQYAPSRMCCKSAGSQPHFDVGTASALGITRLSKKKGMPTIRHTVFEQQFQEMYGERWKIYIIDVLLYTIYVHTCICHQ
jgi:hypothetical protein